MIELLAITLVLLGCITVRQHYELKRQQHVVAAVAGLQLIYLKEYPLHEANKTPPTHDDNKPHSMGFLAR